MRRTSVLAVAGLLTITLAAACTDATDGQAVSNGGNETTSSDPEPPSGTAAPTVELPPRPKELSLNGLEPCAVLTEAQVAQLATEFKFDAPPDQDTSGDEQLCSLEQTAEPFNIIDILLVTDMGIEKWLGSDNNVDSSPATIAGYPAVNYRFRGTEDEECVTSVGVADGQQLTVDFQALVETDYRELCRITDRIATMATETLKTLR